MGQTMVETGARMQCIILALVILLLLPTVKSQCNYQRLRDLVGFKAPLLPILEKIYNPGERTIAFCNAFRWPLLQYLTCNENGTDFLPYWVPCERKCADLGDVAHGSYPDYIRTRLWSFGQLINVTCDAGWADSIIPGPPPTAVTYVTLDCTQVEARVVDSAWTRQGTGTSVTATRLCKVNTQCLELRQLAHGSYGDHDVLHGNVTRVTCDPGWRDANFGTTPFNIECNGLRNPDPNRWEFAATGTERGSAVTAGNVATGLCTENINECSFGYRCGDNARCKDTIGSYICECEDGYDPPVDGNLGDACVKSNGHDNGRDETALIIAIVAMALTVIFIIINCILICCICQLRNQNMAVRGQTSATNTYGQLPASPWGRMHVQWIKKF